MPSSTDTSSPKNAELRADAAASFGWSLALLRSDPELKKLFGRAVKNTYTPDRFVAELRDTKWFRKHSDTWRQNEVLKITDPKTWAQQNAATLAQVKDAAAVMGAGLNPKQLATITHNIQMFGWNESQQRDVLAGYVHVVHGGPLKGQYIGDAGKNSASLRATAANNGYKIPAKSLLDWNRSILRGATTMNDYETFIRRRAAAAFPTFANELAAGANLSDLAAPYKDSMARILELNDRDIDLFDPTIRKALSAKNAKTGKPEAVPLYDFENSLRADPRWTKTDNAHQQIMGLGHQLLDAFGVVAA